MSKKKTCATCDCFLYFPPFVQKTLNELRAFHCTRDKWRDIDDPAIFLKKIKCKQWVTRNGTRYNNYFEKKKMVRTTTTKMVRGQIKMIRTR